VALLIPVFTPARRPVEKAVDQIRAFRQSPNPEYARSARLGLERAVSVNERLMRLYQPYTAFIIVPVVGAFLIDIANAIVISGFAGVLPSLR